MNTKRIPGINLVALAMGVAMALPAKAQQDAMQNMPMWQQPAVASSTSAPASSSLAGMDTAPHASAAKAAHPHIEHAHTAPPASASSAGMSGMQRMNMSCMPAMPMPAQQTSRPASSSSSANGQSMQGMHMSMPMKPSQQPVEMQHLHFGNMIGVRPKPGGFAEGMQGMNMSSMQGMDMPSMQGGNAPADARSPDYSDGYRYTDMPGMAMSDHAKLAMLMIDQLEYAHDNHGNNALFLDGQFWYGEDFNKLWLKFEGEQAHGKLEDLRTEALWNHAISTSWGTQLGVRHDFGEGPGRTWAAFGVEGLAPYWFETEATVYVGQDGRTAARVRFEYEELLTQRLVLQPKFEVNLYGKDDPARGIGSGLSDAELGLRLRYEFKREFAPYVGVVWRQRFGRTADLDRAQREPASDLQFVAGLHFWF